MWRQEKKVGGEARRNQTRQYLVLLDYAQEQSIMLSKALSHTHPSFPPTQNPSEFFDEGDQGLAIEDMDESGSGSSAESDEGSDDDANDDVTSGSAQPGLLGVAGASQQGEPSYN